MIIKREDKISSKTLKSIMNKKRLTNLISKQARDQ